MNKIITNLNLIRMAEEAKNSVCALGYLKTSSGEIRQTWLAFLLDDPPVKIENILLRVWKIESTEANDITNNILKLSTAGIPDILSIVHSFETQTQLFEISNEFADGKRLVLTTMKNMLRVQMKMGHKKFAWVAEKLSNDITSRISKNDLMSQLGCTSVNFRQQALVEINKFF